MFRSAFFLVVLLVVGGCHDLGRYQDLRAPNPAPIPTTSDWNADFGPKPDTKLETHNWIHETFVDPESALIYSIGDPKRTVYICSLTRSKFYGWSYLIDVNGKNQFGGYTGRKVFFLFLKRNTKVWIDGFSRVSKLFVDEFREKEFYQES